MPEKETNKNILVQIKLGYSQTDVSGDPARRWHLGTHGMTVYPLKQRYIEHRLMKNLDTYHKQRSASQYPKGSMNVADHRGTACEVVHLFAKKKFFFFFENVLKKLLNIFAKNINKLKSVYKRVFSFLNPTYIWSIKVLQLN